MVKVLRLTRHDADESQITELTRIFGDVEVTQVSETLLSNSRQVVTCFDELATGFDVVEVVLPVNLLEAVLKFSQFCKDGGMVIRANMTRTLDEDGGVEFTFDHYVKMIKVEVVAEVL